MGINCSTGVLSLSRKNTCKTFQDPWGKGQIALDSISRTDVGNTVRALEALEGGEENVAAKSVTPVIPRVELSHARQHPTAIKVS